MIKLTDILYEATRYKKETGENLFRWQDKLKKYEDTKDYYIHFSNVPRVGLYLINQYNTPIGFYAYPLDFHKMSSFAIERPYAIVFKIKPEANVLKTDAYGWEDLEKDLEYLRRKYPTITDDNINDWSRQANDPLSYSSVIWNITRMLSFESPSSYTNPDFVLQKEISPIAQDLFYNYSKLTDAHQKSNFYKSLTSKEKELFNLAKKFSAYRPIDSFGGGSTGKWSSILYKDLGYDAVSDEGHDIIHESEPYQIVVFNTTVIKVEDIVNITSKISSKADFTNKVKYYKYKDLSNEDFSGQILQKAIFTGSNLTKCKFNFANLFGANLAKTKLIKAEMGDCILSETTMDHADFSGAYLGRANLVLSLATSSNFTDCVLNQAILSNGAFNQSNFTNADLSKIKMHHASFMKTTLHNTNFSKASLQDTNFSDADFSGADFSGADLTGCNLNGINLDKANFKNAIFDRYTRFPKGFDIFAAGLIIEN